MSAIFSSPGELEKIARIIKLYTRLPVSAEEIPGAFLEAALAHVKNAQVLKTYDYIDVRHLGNRVGWSIKSTKHDTPITWMRAKLENKQTLIAQSYDSPEALQSLGNSLIKLCNDRALKSITKYNLDEIGYARLVLFPDRKVRYFERSLCTKASPDIFDATEFAWTWSAEKKTKSKEQLSALHGRHKATGQRWWAWHGAGENQLHFTGERHWWPSDEDSHAISFDLPPRETKLSFDALMDMLEQL